MRFDELRVELQTDPWGWVETPVKYEAISVWQRHRLTPGPAITARPITVSEQFISTLTNLAEATSNRAV